MTEFCCSDLSVQTRSATLLRQISFSAKAGELIGVIGPNGAGKSTLMRAMAGLRSHQGETRWNGRNVSAMTSAERALQIAYMPQERMVHWPMDCLDLVLLGRQPHRARFAATSAEDRDLARSAMHRMDVESFAERAFDTLSGGEQARVLIARMLAQDTACLIADEPVNGLDPGHQIGLMQTFQGLARSGHLVFVALHDLTLAGCWCDRLLLLEKGELRADEQPDILFASGLIEDIYGIRTSPITLESRTTIVPAALRGAAAGAGNETTGHAGETSK